MDESLLNIIKIILTIVLVPLIVGLLFYVIGFWKILKKGGKPGWAALIPIYGQYLLCEMVGVSPWWIAISLLSGIVPYVGPQVSMFANLYFLVILSVSLSRSFGKKDEFSIGLILLYPIFYVILGFNDDKYLGPKPVKDFILDSILNGNKNNQNERKDEEYAPNYCTNCGSKLEKDARFCTHCGKKSK